jgi:hypothetical protein
MLKWLDEDFEKCHITKVLTLGFIDTEDKRRAYLVEAKTEARRKKKFLQEEQHRQEAVAKDKRRARWKQLRQP